MDSGGFMESDMCDDCCMGFVADTDTKQPTVKCTGTGTIHPLPPPPARAIDEF